MPDAFERFGVVLINDGEAVIDVQAFEQGVDLVGKILDDLLEALDQLPPGLSAALRKRVGEALVAD